jgi:hypothetical protein
VTSTHPVIAMSAPPTSLAHSPVRCHCGRLVPVSEYPQLTSFPFDNTLNTFISGLLSFIPCTVLFAFQVFIGDEGTCDRDSEVSEAVDHVCCCLAWFE